MGRSIDHEHPELNCSRVDLPFEQQPEHLEALVEELLADARDNDVALRGARRYVARLAPFDAATRSGNRSGTKQTPPSGWNICDQVLDDIDTRAVARRSPGPGEVEIQVHSTGLNFIDVMRALGVYPGQKEAPHR